MVSFLNVSFLSATLLADEVQLLNKREVDLVWSTSDGQRMEIFYANKKNGDWSEPVRITDDYYNNMYPVIDRDNSGKRWVFWTAYNDGRMELRYTTGNNDEWQESVTLTDEKKTNISPSLVIDKEDTVWVVWSANDGGLDDIYFAVNSEENWSEPQQLHDLNSVADMLPVIELDDSGSPAVKWQSMTDGELTVVASTFADDEWTDPAITEPVEAAEPTDDEIIELPSFINNTSMVFVRVY